MELISSQNNDFVNFEEIERETALLLQAVKGKSAAKKSTPTTDLKVNSKSKRKLKNNTVNKGDKALHLSNTSNFRTTLEVFDDNVTDMSPRFEGDDNDFEFDSKTIKKNLEMRKSEELYRDASFFIEKKRILIGDDTFVPAPGKTLDEVENERNRIQKIEDSSRINREKNKDSPVSVKTFDRLSKYDLSVIKVQSLFRGYLGRKKFILCKRIDSLSRNYDVENDWIEVRDRANGDCWYYNKVTGLSQWERPNEMKDILTSNSKIKLIPITGKGDKVQKKSKSIISKKLESVSPIATSRTNSANAKTALKPIKMSSFNDTSSSAATENLYGTNNSLLSNSSSTQEIYAAARKEVDAIMGIDKLIPDDKLITPDGYFKPQLRTTVLDALLESRFDSVATVISDGNWINSDEDQFKTKISKNNDDQYPVNRLNKPMVAVFNLNEKKNLRKSYELNVTKTKTKNTLQSLKDLTIGEINYPGFDNTSADLSNEVESSQSRPANVCFACWSAGSRSCNMHNPNPDIKLKPNESMLLCRNWDLTIMRRRYRSEEIQEIFMKKNASLRYDTRRKKFSTVEEYRHVIYRTLKQLIYQRNYSSFVVNKVKRWMISLSDVIRLFRGHRDERGSNRTENGGSDRNLVNLFDFIENDPNTEEHSKVMRLKRARINDYNMRKVNNQVRHKLALPPTTGYSYPERVGTEKLLFQAADAATGTLVELIIIKPLPVSSALYSLREYHLGIPKSIPMPLPSYSPGILQSILPSNTFMNELMPGSWFEKLITSFSYDAMQSALSQVQTILPVSEFDKIRYTKQPLPSTIKFATFGHKPTPNLLASGGLPYELLTYQLLTTYYPPQYGNFIVTDKAVVNPGISPEVMITFQTLIMPPIKQDYILRPVEHPLNYRKVPTLAINSLIAVDNKFYYGKNRPEQTGEQESHGFRTSTHCRYLHIYEETDPTIFAPSDDIVSFNIPGSNKSYTTHADLTYPFCEPSTRDNSTLDFYHLLLSGMYSFSKPQVFTVLTAQEPGQFLKEARDDLPMGYLVVSIYRSWAFVQRDIIEEFKTDDGVPYWYHRRTGQTFWVRPLYDEEEVSPMEGGTVLDTNHPEEPMVSRVGPEGYNRRYLQGDVRKSILSHHESDREAIRRRWNAAESAINARDKGMFPDPVKTPTAATFNPSTVITNNGEDNSDTKSSSVLEGLSTMDALVQDRNNNTVMNLIIASKEPTSNYAVKELSMMEETVGFMDSEINLKKNKVSSINDNSAVFETNLSSPARMTVNVMPLQSPQSTTMSKLIPSPKPKNNTMRFGMNEMSEVSEQIVPDFMAQSSPVKGLSTFNPDILNNITESIGKLLSGIDSSNPQDMIKLGLGMGMAIMQTSNGFSNIIDNSFQSMTNNGLPPRDTASRGITPQILSPHSNYDNGDENSMISVPTVSEVSYNDSLKNQESSPHYAVVRLNETTSEPIGLPNPTVTSSAHRKLDHDEEIHQRQNNVKNLSMPLSTVEKARKIQFDVNKTNALISAGGLTTDTPDEALPKSLTVELPLNADENMREKVPVLIYPDLATNLENGVPPESRTHEFMNGIINAKDMNGDDAGVDSKKMAFRRANVMPLPKGFYNAIIASHVAKQEADYLPQVPNLPQTRTVGRVKPRSTALDWIAISFDPWSAGKAPVNSEFVNSLSANATKFFEGGQAKAIDAIEMLRQEAIGDSFAPLEDVDGLVKQRAEISRAQMMAQDFKKVCSLCRHNKNSEVEQLINQPDWNLPIDYQDDQGNTLLHIAAQNGNKRMIKIFMRRGVTLDTQNLQGQTALHYLNAFGYTDVADYLVKKGANDSLKNKDGLTCYEGLGARELSLL